jgi:Sulfotransferase family
VPDFFIVGAPKTGTTALYEMLRVHPRIFLPELKEPRFLASDMLPVPELAGEPRELAYPRTLEDYLALFRDAGPEQRAGEASTFYLWSHTAADAIADLQPDARIVAIVREPASFLRSMHLMFLRWGIESERDLRKAMSLEADRSEGRNIPSHSHRPQLLQYSEHVRYVEQLRRYDARFSAEQLLVLIYEDFHRDNDATVRKVMRFLEVEDDVPIDVVNVNVTTRTVRSWRLKHMLRAVRREQGPIARPINMAVKTLTTRRLRRGMNRTVRNHLVTAQAPPRDEDFMAELRRRFKPEVVALGERLDRDLVSLWGYDEID